MRKCVKKIRASQKKQFERILFVEQKLNRTAYTYYSHPQKQPLIKLLNLLTSNNDSMYTCCVYCISYIFLHQQPFSLCGTLKNICRYPYGNTILFTEPP